MLLCNQLVKRKGKMSDLETALKELVVWECADGIGVPIDQLDDDQKLWLIRKTIHTLRENVAQIVWSYEREKK